MTFDILANYWKVLMLWKFAPLALWNLMLRPHLVKLSQINYLYSISILICSTAIYNVDKKYYFTSLNVRKFKWRILLEESSWKLRVIFYTLIWKKIFFKLFENDSKKKKCSIKCVKVKFSLSSPFLANSNIAKTVFDKNVKNLYKAFYPFCLFSLLKY